MAGMNQDEFLQLPTDEKFDFFSFQLKNRKIIRTYTKSGKPEFLTETYLKKLKKRYKVLFKAENPEEHEEEFMKIDEILDDMFDYNFESMIGKYKLEDEKISTPQEEKAGPAPKEEQEEEAGPPITEESGQEIISNPTDIMAETTVRIDPESLAQLAEIIMGARSGESQGPMVEQSRGQYESIDEEPKPDDYAERETYEFARRRYEENQRLNEQFQEENAIRDAGIVGLYRQLDNVNAYLDPFRNKSRDDIADELNKIGMGYFNVLSTDTKQDLMEKLNFLKNIEVQSKLIADYKRNKPVYLEEGYERNGIDMLTKDGQKTPSNIPLQKKYKFLNGIPSITMNFNPNDGLFHCKQGSEVYLARSYASANKFCTLGGFYSRELAQLRKIADKQLKLKYQAEVIFKARKI